MRPIPELTQIDPVRFRDEIMRAQHPVVLRGLAADWPAVRAAATDVGLAGYLGGFDRGAPVEALIGPPAIRGRFFYNKATRGMNFEHWRGTLRQALAGLLEVAGQPNPPCLYIASTPVPSLLPGFERDNALNLLGPEITPRLWLGNATTVQTHYDMSDNIACVVAGRRRFTLFPPDQVANLYVGPLEFTPAGRPISMVSLDDPDLERYPRFAQALEFALFADLEPGDAIFIPAMWWHHVQAFGSLNLLVNYWWSQVDPLAGSPFDAFVHALNNVRHLPPPQREAWRALFEHYVFEADGDPVAHLPVEVRGVLGALTEQTAAEVRRFLLKGLG